MIQPTPSDCPIPGSEGFAAPEGTCANGVLILGEALGEAEAHDSLPFRPYAQSGAVLQRALNKCGFRREQFLIHNVVPVRPPNNWLEGAPWEHKAVAWGTDKLREVIHEYKPRCVLALGNIPTRAATALVGDHLSVSYIRGYVLPGVLVGVPVVASFHPAFLRRGAMGLLSVLMHDIKLAVAVANTEMGATTKFFSPVVWRDFEYTARPIPDPMNPIVPAGYVTHATEADAWAFYNEARANPERLIAYDIETPRSTQATEDESDELADTVILSIQFSIRRGTGIFMPWRDPFTTIATRILSLPNPKGGANTWRFDDPLLAAHNAPVAGKRHDVRWMWHHLQPDLKGSLQFISSFYGMSAPWKNLHQSHSGYYGIADVDAVVRILTDDAPTLEQQ